MNDPLCESVLLSTLRENYYLEVVSLVPLDLGEDYYARTFKVVATTGKAYFLKVRSQLADAAALEIPRYLHARGISQALAPLAVQSGERSVRLEGQQFILYPFISAESAAKTGLTPTQWAQLGRAVHAWQHMTLPDRLVRLVERETFSPEQRTLAADYLQRALSGEFDRGAGQPLAAVLRAHQDEITHALERAGALAASLAANPPPFVLCHGDLTPWNILVQHDGKLAIVDWDSPRLAPREYDLMVIGGNLTGRPDDPAAETSFYQGYGRITVDPSALAYFRYERVIADLAAFCREMWQQPSPGAQRLETITTYVASNFGDNGTLAAARRADQSS
ncbi:MAG: phosphotransferase [Anaerolineae bacterium]|nr:phosphotransferase [Anaerolineae bacterium]